MTIDLDAVIAAEVAGEPLEVTVAGNTYRLRPEMPWDTAVLIGRNAVADAFAGLCVDVDDDGEPDTEKAAAFAAAVLADRPPWPEITRRMNAIYGTGESGASQRSSTNGGRRSRPTSKGSTGSTSAAP